MDSNIIMIIVGLIVSVAMLGFTIASNRKEHPQALFVLFFTEMWERFSFYGMKALLIFYMTQELAYNDSDANQMLGSYMALVYALPLIGGMLADRLLGFRKAIVLGAVMMALGHFVLAFPAKETFFLGLAFIISGNGFFKPNISSLVGKFYESNDSRKDSAFSIFYMGINIGALMGGLLCGYLGQNVNWHIGFGLAGIFMLLGLIVFTLNKEVLEDKGLPPDPAKLKKKLAFGISNENGVYLASVLILPLYIFLVINYRIMGNSLLYIALITLGYLLYLASRQERKQGQMMLAAIIMIIFSTIFWTFFELSGGALNLFADRNVDLVFGGTELSSAAVNNSINPLWIIILGPIFAALWKYLSDKNIEPTAPIKFGLGFLQLGLGFYMFVVGAHSAGADGQVPFIYFVLGYLFMSSGELCLSPIGLSMITKLSPAKIVGFVMGTWFLASSCGQFMAGVIGAMMAVPSEEGNITVTPVESLEIYAPVFQQIALVALGAGLLMLVLSPLLRKWMHGIK